MFFYFSSAFNTIQPHLLAEKLLKMKLSVPTVLWVTDYLTNRPQFVRAGIVPSNSPNSNIGAPQTVISSVLKTNTGAPQGTVLSPFLFSLYTADCRSSHGSCLIDKFADDTGLTGQITDDNDTHYRQEVNNFVDWCEENYLDLNTGKTKEMIFDTRRKKG
jgi:hypothetical protein